MRPPVESAEAGLAAIESVTCKTQAVSIRIRLFTCVTPWKPAPLWAAGTSFSRGGASFCEAVAIPIALHARKFGHAACLAHVVHEVRQTDHRDDRNSELLPHLLDRGQGADG